MAGRPTEYKPEYCEQVMKLCKLGATDDQIAQFFEVEESTINNWKTAHPEFMESVRAGKIIADAEVANSFHKRAVGYKYDEVTYEKIDVKKDGMEVDPDGDIEDTKAEVYKRKVVTKEIPPDAGAALNWLKNRQKEIWRDKVETEISNKPGESFDITLNLK